MSAIEMGSVPSLPGGKTVATTDQLISGGGGSATIPLGSLMKPMTGAHPAVDATNGPLTADTFIVAGAPSTSGKTLYAWNSGVFRTQGMNWVAGSTAANTSGFSACINASTSRVWSYGTTQGQPIESNHDFSFITDALSVTIFYYNWNGYTGGNYHDHRIFVEHEGDLKSLRDSGGAITPTASTAGGGLMSRTITFKEAREREIRVMLPSRMYFIGVYIDTQATIRKAAPMPLIVGNGDSWQEPNGSIVAAPVGGAFSAGGTFLTMGLPQELAVATGFAIGLLAQGGTGHFNVNDGQNRADSYVGGAGESTFFGVRRMDDFITKFGSSYPILMTVGGWNDGTLVDGPTYLTRITEGLNYLKSKKSDIRFFGVGIEPVGDQAGNVATMPANYIAMNNALKSAYTAAGNSANSLGFIDIFPMWPNTSMAGQRGWNVNTADKIHLNAKGAQLVATYLRAAMAAFMIPQSYINQQLLAAA